MTGRAHTAPAPRHCLPFWCFYIHQGMVTALIARGVGAWFREQGWSLAALSYLSLAMLPWVFKAMWAPWAERHALAARGNRYLGSLAVTQLAMALVLLATGWLLPTDAPWLIVAALLWLALLSATHDIFADGIVIGTTDASTRPAANMAQVGGSYVGLACCPPLFLAVAQAGGWAWAMSALAVVSLLLLWLPWRFSRPLPATPARDAARPAAAGPSGTLWPGLCLAAVAYPAMRGMMALEAPLLMDAGLSLAEAGAALAVYGTGGSALGVVAGGWIARHVRPVPALLAILSSHAVLLALACLLQPVLDAGGWQRLIGATSVAAAAAFVQVYRMLMDYVRPARPAADYALFQSIDAAVAIGVSLGTLQLAGVTGYRTTLALLAALATASLLMVLRLGGRLQAPALALAAGPIPARPSRAAPADLETRS
ncbi:MFS transporter [Cupriavidus pauculus]|uniref:MFS transporter n=1 Tax=Cupriavidus pauculus TaxID=82633 RepID=UPI0015628548|nr:MFS transporter [Cupriavidus pauculus]